MMTRRTRADRLSPGRPPRSRTRRATAGARQRAASSGDLDDDVGGLDGGNRVHAGLEPEFLDCLSRGERDDAMRPGEYLDGCHETVDLDLGHDAREAVAGA